MWTPGHAVVWLVLAAGLRSLCRASDEKLTSTTSDHGVCGGTIYPTDSEYQHGQLVSPNFPRSYFPGVHCTWTFIGFRRLLFFLSEMSIHRHLLFRKRCLLHLRGKDALRIETANSQTTTWCGELESYNNDERYRVEDAAGNDVKVIFSAASVNGAFDRVWRKGFVLGWVKLPDTAKVNISFVGGEENSGPLKQHQLVSEDAKVTWFHVYITPRRNGLLVAEMNVLTLNCTTLQPVLVDYAAGVKRDLRQESCSGDNVNQTFLYQGEVKKYAPLALEMDASATDIQEIRVTYHFEKYYSFGEENDEYFMENLALDKPATQSATREMNVTWYGAENAVDGDRDSVMPHGSCTDTGRVTIPWWSVDLLDSYEIHYVIISFPQGCCWADMSAYEVLVSDKEGQFSNYDKCFSIRNLTGVDGVTEKSQASTPAPLYKEAVATRLDCSQPVIGRFVAILKAEQPLVLCEVEVYGNAMRGMHHNVAYAKTAKQSVIPLDNEFAGQHPASLPLQGFRDSGFDHCSHTSPDVESPSWEVDLWAVFDIYEVIITNSDNNEVRALGDFDIRVRSGLRWRDAGREAGALCYHESLTLPVNSTKIYRCQNAPLRGRIVVIEMVTGNLSLCGVEVMVRTSRKDFYSQRRDLARNAPAIQSSTKPNMAANLAVDGTTETCAESAPDDALPWWLVDLGQEFDVPYVFVVFSFRRSVFNSWSKIWLEVMKLAVWLYPGDSVDDVPKVDTDWRGRCGPFEIYVRSKLISFCATNGRRRGRFVVIRKISPKLKICEVQVVSRNAFSPCIHHPSEPGDASDLGKYSSFNSNQNVTYAPYTTCTEAFVKPHQPDAGKFVQVFLRKLDIEDSPACLYDYVQIGGRRLCGYRPDGVHLTGPHGQQIIENTGHIPVNVALRKQAKQTTDSLRQSYLAVDGDRETCSVVNGFGEPNVFWEVDLGEMLDIHGITVIFDTNETHANNFDVSVFTHPDLSTSTPPSETSGWDFWVDCRHVRAEEGKVDAVCNGGVQRARVVRVHQKKTSPESTIYLALCEVEVWSNMGVPMLRDRNVALGRKTFTAEVFGNLTSHLVVDGDPDSDPSLCMNRNSGWWAVDLANVYRISGLVITTPSTDAPNDNSTGLGDFEIALSYTRYGRKHSCFIHRRAPLVNLQQGETGFFPCYRVIEGRFVFVISLNQREPNWISLCEVQVLGVPTGLYRENVAIHKPAVSVPRRIQNQIRPTDGAHSAEDSPDFQCPLSPLSGFESWRVDLMGVYEIYAVVITAGIDKNSFEVYVYSEWGDPASVILEQAPVGTFCVGVVDFPSYLTTRRFDCHRPISGRYVQLRGSGRPVHFCEVQVLASSQNQHANRNLALYKYAQLSSTHNTSTVASNAVDGIWGSECAISGLETNPWLLVDLISVYRIYIVLMDPVLNEDFWSCRECGPDLWTMAVYLKNPLVAKDGGEWGEPQHEKNFTVTPSTVWALFWFLDKNTAGRYLSLRMSNVQSTSRVERQIAVCEIAVMGVPYVSPNWFGVPFGSLDVTFESDSKYGGTGFDAVYGKTDLKKMRVARGCGGILEFGKNVTSPGFPGTYGTALDNYICQWIFLSQINGTLAVQVTDVDLARDPLYPEYCFGDMVVMTTTLGEESVFCSTSYELIYPFRVVEDSLLTITFFVRTRQIPVYERENATGFSMKVVHWYENCSQILENNTVYENTGYPDFSMAVDDCAWLYETSGDYVDLHFEVIDFSLNPLLSNLTELKKALSINLRPQGETRHLGPEDKGKTLSFQLKRLSIGSLHYKTLHQTGFRFKIRFTVRNGIYLINNRAICGPRRDIWLLEGLTGPMNYSTDITLPKPNPRGNLRHARCVFNFRMQRASEPIYLLYQFINLNMPEGDCKHDTYVSIGDQYFCGTGSMKNMAGKSGFSEFQVVFETSAIGLFRYAFSVKLVLLTAPQSECYLCGYRDYGLLPCQSGMHCAMSQPTTLNWDGSMVCCYPEYCAQVDGETSAVLTLVCTNTES